LTLYMIVKTGWNFPPVISIHKQFGFSSRSNCIFLVGKCMCMYSMYVPTVCNSILVYYIFHKLLLGYSISKT
jgi:hypothetical protein